jgi:septal ring factor EnvC (AmiA/AmiB activator)
MTGEEMERAIDFLLKSLANLEARIEQVNSNLGARIDETNRQLAETNRQLAETNKQVAETNRQLIETNKQLAGTDRQLAGTNNLLGEYASAQTTFIEVVTRTFEAQAAINRRTDERLNALIGTVERVISERGGGGNT